MKRLMLIRHAKAQAESPSGQDFDRQLSVRGVKDAHRMGQWLAQLPSPGPQHFLSSPAARAIATARIISQEIGFAPGEISQDPGIYEAPVANLLASIRRSPESCSLLWMAGHNPGMEMLANFLAGSSVIQGFATCGIAQLELRIDRWQALSQGCGALADYTAPEMLD